MPGENYPLFISSPINAVDPKQTFPQFSSLRGSQNIYSQSHSAVGPLSQSQLQTNSTLASQQQTHSPYRRQQNLGDNLRTSKDINPLIKVYDYKNGIGSNENTLSLSMSPSKAPLNIPNSTAASEDQPISQYSKRTDFLYHKINFNLKTFISNLENKCDQINLNIDNLIKEGFSYTNISILEQSASFTKHENQ
jgi:hypothetical protein